MKVFAGCLLIATALVVTLILQVWIGNVTIYHPRLDAQREALHEYLFWNRLPPGTTWSDLGANSDSVRIFPVYLAEAVRRITSFRVLSIYKAIDTVALFLSLVCLFAYLRAAFPPLYALAGLLYVAVVLPLTYFLHYFHPWDRLWLLAWVVCVWLLRERRLAWFAVAVAIGVTIKYDMVVVPGLYFLAAVERRSYVPVTARTVAMFALAFGTLGVLTLLAPGGFEPRAIVAQVTKNIEVIRIWHVRYPPLLAFAIPWILAIVGFKSTDRFGRAGVIFAALLVVPLFLGSNFVEVRAELMLLLLVLPAALCGLQSVIEEGHGARTSVQTR